MSQTPSDPSGGSSPFKAVATNPVFDSKAMHQQRPRLRAVRTFGTVHQNQQLLGIADMHQVSDRVVLTSPAAQLVLPLMDGKNGLDDIVTKVGRGLTRSILEQLVAQLDDAALLFGPPYDALVAKARADFDSAPNLPPASTAQVVEALAQQEVLKDAGGQGQEQVAQQRWNAMSDADKTALGASRLRAIFDEWIAMALKDAEKPSLDALPKAIVAPHLDYPRGWINYASAWGRLRVTDRPERVVILGTNHFGMATGVCGCDKGFETALGTCEADLKLIAELKKHLGDAATATLFEHRLDHEREHSVELQIPWIQHILGKDERGSYPKVFAALIHDPSVNNGESYDGKGLALDPFLDALRKAIAALPGKTLVVASADLSHVGPAFGDQIPMAGEDPQVVQARNNVFKHDQEMIRLLADRKPDELVAAMSWQQNPTRWCSTGNLVATMRLVNPTKVEVFNYAGAMDEQGNTLVTSVSMAMMA